MSTKNGDNNHNRRLWLSPEDISKLTSCNNRRSNKRTGDEDEEEEDDDNSQTKATSRTTVDTYDTIFDHFSVKPKPKSLSFLLANTMVSVQEFVLTCLLLALHRAARLEELYYRRRYQQPNGIGDIENVGITEATSTVFEGGVFHTLIDGGIHSNRLLTSLGLIWLTLIVAVVKNRFANSKRYTIRHRFTDFLLMAILLRFLSAVLKTLTASYSSDTVYAWSIVSLFLHLTTCNYEYANGLCDNEEEEDDDDGNHDDDGDVSDNASTDNNCCDTAILLSSSRHIPDNYYCTHKNQERPTFKGGMMSLTSAFFATTLLASRLESNAAVYIFTCSSVILFALYPAARHLVAVKSRHVGKWIPMFVSGILTLALIILLEPTETLMVLMITSFLGIFVPIWKYHLQYYKTSLRGPWDIARV